MTIKSFSKALGTDLSFLPCVCCCNASAEVVYLIDHNEKANPDPSAIGSYTLLCRRCAVEIALGLLRDFAALQVGEKKAQSGYVELRSKHKQALEKIVDLDR